MPGESLPDTATGYACKDGPTGLQPMLEYSRDVKDPKGGQPHPLRIHHADELRHCLPQTCGCCPWHAEALPRALWEAGGTRVLWVPLSPHNYPGQTLLCPQVPGCRGDGDHGGQQVPCPLCPVVTPGMGPFPTVGPAGRGGGGSGDTPCPALLPPPIRDPRAAPAPSANHSPAPILFTANPRGRWGRGQHGRFPASQSAPGCGCGGVGGAGRGRSPWRVWHMAGSRRGAAGAGLRCWGALPGCRRHSPAGIRASRYSWSPPALWLAGSSPGSCRSCCWQGCPLIWAPHG